MISGVLSHGSDHSKMTLDPRVCLQLGVPCLRFLEAGITSRLPVIHPKSTTRRQWNLQLPTMARTQRVDRRHLQNTRQPRKHGFSYVLTYTSQRNVEVIHPIGILSFWELAPRGNNHSIPSRDQPGTLVAS